MLIGLRVLIEDARGGHISRPVGKKLSSSSGRPYRVSGREEGGCSLVTRLSWTFHLTRVAVITWKQEEDRGLFGSSFLLLWNEICLFDYYFKKKRRMGRERRVQLGPTGGTGQTARAPASSDFIDLFWRQWQQQQKKSNSKREKNLPPTHLPGPLWAPVCLSVRIPNITSFIWECFSNRMESLLLL